MLNLIWAESKDGIIGKGNKLPWNIKTDLKFFKDTTSGHSIVMGNSTFKSLGEKPLPNRKNYVLTNNEDLLTEDADNNDVIYTKNFKYFIELAKTEDVFIIGGASIYKLFMDYADKIYRTKIDKLYTGDTKAEPIDKLKWVKVSSTHVKNNREPNLYFEVFRRIDNFL